jgi:hypothetical protein
MAAIIIWSRFISDIFDPESRSPFDNSLIDWKYEIENYRLLRFI